MVDKVLTVLFVADQERSRAFYAAALNRQPSLHVPGMTMFSLREGCDLGLMPAQNIKRILGEKLPHPAAAAGIPRSELYLYVDDPLACHARALQAGGNEISEPQLRDWGDLAGYSLDPDGHLLAFAKTSRA